MRVYIPLPNRLLFWLAAGLFALAGWHLDATLPDLPKYVIIFAPHTSYWDGLLGILAGVIVTRGFATLQISWLGKHTLFVWPLGWLMRWVGGVPVDRRARHALVDQVVDAFRRRPRLVLAVTPEGARHKTAYWKTGFYYIAEGAHVPMLPAYIDYKTKTVGTGPLMTPSGDITADMTELREFYGRFTARHPEKMGEIAVAPRDE